MSNGQTEADKIAKAAVTMMLAEDAISMGDLYLAMVKATFKLSMAIGEDIKEVPPLILEQDGVRLAITFDN